MVSVQQDSEPESDIKSYKRSRYNETLIQLANLTKNSDPLLTISGIDLDSASSLRKADAKDAVTSALPAVKVNTNLENSAELESQNSNYKSEVDNLFTKLRETLVVDKVDDATQLFIDNPSKDPFAALMSGIDKFSAKKRDEVLIANFKNTDSGTNPSEVTKNKLKKSNSNEESFDATTLDLNHVVKKFVNAYVAGDLKQFDTLFDEQAKTNDQKDLAGIKHDYLDLFSTTSSRNMVITDIHWILSEKQAIGLGDFTATVADSAGRTKRSENGKVQIIARKVDSELKITHFYHTVGDK
jgi:hypothetical protein